MSTTTMHHLPQITPPGDHPAMRPPPGGVPVPDAVRAAADAYAAARVTLDEAWEAHRHAEKRDTLTDRDYRAALAHADAAGLRRADVQRAPQRVAATGPAYEAALHAALEAEIAYADAIYDHRHAWLEDIERARADAEGRVGDLFRQLAVALRDTHALRVLATVLKAWRYDTEADPGSRLRILHKSSKPAHRPDFPSVTAEQARNETRMAHVRSAAEAP